MSAPLTEPLPHLPADAWIGKDATGEPIGVVLEDGVPRPWYFGKNDSDPASVDAWRRVTWEDYAAEILGRWGLAQREIAAAERALRVALDTYGHILRPRAIVEAEANLRALGVDP